MSSLILVIYNYMFYTWLYFTYVQGLVKIIDKKECSNPTPPLV